MKRLSFIKTGVFCLLLAGTVTSLVLVPAASAANAKKVVPKKNQHKNRGAVQFTVRELITVKNGKKTKAVYKNRGNVLVELRRTPKNTSGTCRDGLVKKIIPKVVYNRQNVPLPNAPKVVFAHTTDANPRNVKNIGKVKIDSCTVGTYVAVPRLSPQYKIVKPYKPGLPVKPIQVNKGVTAKVTITIQLTKAAAATQPVFSTIPISKITDRLPLPDNGETLDDFDGTAVDPNDPDNGISDDDGQLIYDNFDTVPPIEDVDTIITE